MRHSVRTSGKILIAMLMISLLLTGCALMPSTMGGTTREALDGTGESGTVTISREEYERLLKYVELDEILQTIEIGYYQEPDVDAMMESATQGLLYGLDDPYTFFYTPEQFAKMWEEDKGEYTGIGIQLMASHETFLCMITRVFEDTPAFKAGVRKGDILTKVEDLEVTAYTLSDAVDIMRGEIGKSVNIQVMRGDELLDFTVVRSEIHINWASSCMLDENIGYIALYEFASGSHVKFQEHKDALVAKGAKALVIDLRDNPGGWIDAATHMADSFLPEGTITYLEDRDGNRDYYKSKKGEYESEMPLVVIINENSASASEILAGALQDYNRATIVGTKSFGKGIVQRVMHVGTRGAGMQFTSAQYFTPNGNKVHKVGIAPDVEAQMPEGDTTIYQLGDLSDAQLQKAYEVALELAVK